MHSHDGTFISFWAQLPSMAYAQHFRLALKNRTRLENRKGILIISLRTRHSRRSFLRVSAAHTIPEQTRGSYSILRGRSKTVISKAHLLYSSRPAMRLAGRPSSIKAGQTHGKDDIEASLETMELDIPAPVLP
jgi:hypothetical protein